MWIIVILASLLVALIRKGRFDLPKFHGIYFIAASVVLQLIAIFVNQSVIGNIVVSVSYLTTILFLFSNREFEEMRIVMIGWLLNAIAVWSNFGRMPVDLEQAKKLPFPIESLLNGTDWKHSIITESTHFPILSDIFYISFPVQRVLSIGDIFLVIGIFLLIQRLMNKPISLLKIREGKRDVQKTS